MLRFLHSLCLLLFLLAICPFWLASCAPGPPTAEIYRPPTSPVVTGETPAGDVAIQNLAESNPALQCMDGLRFLGDLTVPDGTIVQPGEAIDKQWLVQNDGTCNWDVRYRLRLTGGPNLGAEAEQALYPARGGAQVALRILFTAPLEPGTYQSAWQAYDPRGQPFGDAVFISIVVK